MNGTRLQSCVALSGRIASIHVPCGIESTGSTPKITALVGPKSSPFMLPGVNIRDVRARSRPRRLGLWADARIHARRCPGSARAVQARMGAAQPDMALELYSRRRGDAHRSVRRASERPATPYARSGTTWQLPRTTSSSTLRGSGSSSARFSRRGTRPSRGARTASVSASAASRRSSWTPTG